MHRGDNREELFMSTTKMMVVSIRAVELEKAGQESQQFDGKMPVFSGSKW
jgi:hypothetical protein